MQLLDGYLRDFDVSAESRSLSRIPSVRRIAHCDPRARACAWLTCACVRAHRYQPLLSEPRREMHSFPAGADAPAKHMVQVSLTVGNG